MITFDSDSQLFTLLPQNQVPGEVVALPGSDCIDDVNNLWAFRYTDSGNIYSLDYRTPSETGSHRLSRCQIQKMIYGHSKLMAMAMLCLLMITAEFGYSMVPFGRIWVYGEKEVSLME